MQPELQDSPSDTLCLCVSDNKRLCYLEIQQKCIVLEMFIWHEER